MPTITKVKYTGSGARGQSAARLSKYLEYREREDEEGNQRYERLEETFGNSQEFKEAAKERAEEGRRASYLHIVVSPEEGEKLDTADFERIKEQWVYNHRGEELPHFAAVHRDESEHDHLHIAVARDKYVKADLEDRKEASSEIIQERERQPEREEEFEIRMERELDKELQRQEPEREPERQRQQQEQDPGGDRDEGREMER